MKNLNAKEILVGLIAAGDAGVDSWDNNACDESIEKRVYLYFRIADQILYESRGDSYYEEK